MTVTKLNANKQILEESIGIKLLDKDLQAQIQLIATLEKRLAALEHLKNPDGTDPNFVKAYSESKS